MRYDYIPEPDFDMIPEYSGNTSEYFDYEPDYLETIPRDLYEDVEEDNSIHYKVPRRKTLLSLCSVEYIIDEKGNPVVLLFSRDRFGNDYVIPVYGFRPYFYTSENDLAYLTSFADDNDFKIDYKITTVPGFKSPCSLYKIYTELPRDVSKLVKCKKGDSRFNIDAWESDVLFSLRYIIDNGIKSGFVYDPVSQTIEPQEIEKSYLRRLYVDIELQSPKTPDIETHLDPVTVIGLYDNIAGEYTVFSTKNPEVNLEEYLVQDKKIRFYYCANEKDLLMRYLSYVSNTKPDVFLSFTELDWFYPVKRMKMLGLDFKSMSRVNVVQMYGANNVKIHGLEFMDIQKMYYQVFLSGSKWETLHDIATEELGEEKLYREESVYENWIEHPERVLIRNIRDVEIIKRLDEELSLLDYFDAVKRTVGCNFKDTLYKSRVADIMYLRLCHNELILPSKAMVKKIEYEGGIVFPVTPGIYHDIVVLDWSSMYPSIIKCFNINILEPVRAPYKKRAKDKSLPLEERLFNNAVSQGVKSIINSIYGIYGHSGDTGKEHHKAYRLYLPYLAAATTYVGRKLEEIGLKNVCTRLGYEIIYADTDSVFLQLKTTDYENEIKYLEETLSQEMNDFIYNRWGVNPEGLSLSFENHFETLIMLSKKRYIAKIVDGQIKTRGMEMIRRDTAEITANA